MKNKKLHSSSQFLILLGLLLSFSVLANVGSVNKNKMQQLKSSVQQAKIFPDMVETENDFMGSAVAIDGNRALVAAPKLSGMGVVYVYDYVGGVWQESAVLAPNGPRTADGFGTSVSLKGDLVLIGAPKDADNGTNAGAAYIFELIAGSWVQQQKLTPDDGDVEHNFGWSVSLNTGFALIGTKYYFTVNEPGAAYLFNFNVSNDIWLQYGKITALDGLVGNEFGSAVSLTADNAFIGASNDSENGTRSGAVYVYEKVGVSWVFKNKLIASDGSSFDFFGIQISADGDRVLISARNDDSGDFSNSGSAYIFDYDGFNWTQTAKLTASDASSDNFFGSSVSLMGDRALIGAFNAPSMNNSSPGAVYLFQYSGSWIETGRFNASDNSALDEFGIAVALGADKFIVGDSRDDDNGNNAGSAYVFDSTSGWQQQAKLLSSLGPHLDSYGSAVSIDGTRAVVGAPYNDVHGLDAGAVYVFDYVAGNWQLSQQLYASDASASDWFGTSVSLSGDRLVVGAPGEDSEGINAGAVYVFDLNSGTWTQTDQLVVASLNAHDRFGTAVSLDVDRILVGAYGVDLTGINFGAAYIFDLVAGNWAHTTTLTASDGANLDSFGESVSLDGNRALVGASRDDDNWKDSGSAYVFDLINGIWTETDKVTAGPNAAEGVLFGNTLSLYNDTLLIGASHEKLNTGAAYVFEYDSQSNGWSLAQILKSDNRHSGDYFGISLDIDNNIIIIGASGTDNSGNQSGSAYVFQKLNGSWQQTENIISNDGATNHELGQAVSISSELTVIGAPHADGQGKESGAAYVFDVDILPVAVDDYVVTNEDTRVAFYPMTNDSDVDGGVNSIIETTNPLNGTVYISDSKLEYVPLANYCNDGINTDDFTYTINGGSTATVFMTVECVEEIPVAVDDVFITDEDVVKQLDVLLNDYDVDSDHDSIQIQSTTQPAHGIVENFITYLRYTPTADYCNDANSTDDFTYEINGGWVATVKMTVNCVDDAAIAENDYASINEDETILLNVTANDIDIDGGVPFEIIGFTQPQFGTVNNESGHLRYMPNTDYCNDGVHIDDFGYTITSGGSARVEVTVYCVNDQPDFSHLGNISSDLITNHLITNWAYDFDFGALNENYFQDVLQFNAQIVSDSNGVIDPLSLEISLDGNLLFTTTGHLGTAIVEVSMQDDGGTVRGGIDTSETKSLTITFDDTIFVNGFENNTKQSTQDYLAKIAQVTTDFELPYYDPYSNVVVFYQYQLELDTEFFIESSTQMLTTWLMEILKLNNPLGDFDSDGVINELDDDITIH